MLRSRVTTDIPDGKTRRGLERVERDPKGEDDWLKDERPFPVPPLPPPFLDSSKPSPVKHPRWRHINTIDIYRAFGHQITPVLQARKLCSTLSLSTQLCTGGLHGQGNLTRYWGGNPAIDKQPIQRGAVILLGASCWVPCVTLIFFMKQKPG